MLNRFLKIRFFFQNQNIPVGTLIDGFELINEASGSGFLDDQLVDVSDYSRDRTTKLDRNRNSPELIVALLQRKVQGIRFSSNYGREEEPCVIEVIEVDLNEENEPKRPNSDSFRGKKQNFI